MTSNRRLAIYRRQGGGGSLCVRMIFAEDLTSCVEDRAVLGLGVLSAPLLAQDRGEIMTARQSGGVILAEDPPSCGDDSFVFGFRFLESALLVP